MRLAEVEDMFNRKQPGGDPPGSAVSSADGLVGDGEVGPIVPGDVASDQATADAVARLTDGDLPAAEKRRALGQIVTALRARGLPDVRKARSVMAWVGDAVVERLRVGSLRVNGARLVDLDLLVREPGRAEFRTRVRTLVDEFLASQVQPGAVLRVGRPRADRDEVVLLP